MRTLNLNRMFDAVFIHDAISCMLSEGDLLQTFQTAFRHCKPGGCLIMVPDYFQETFLPETAHGGTDSNNGGMRYLERTYAPAGQKQTIIKDFAFLLKDIFGNVRLEYDCHRLGLFNQATWLRLLAEAGFQSEIIEVPYVGEGIAFLHIIYAKKQ